MNVNLFAHAFSQIAATAAGSLVASVWEGLLLIFAVALSMRLLSGLNAAARSAVWIGVLMMVLAIPLFSIAGTHVHAVAGEHGDLFRLNARWSTGLLAMWAALSLFRLVELVWSAARLRGLSRRAVPMRAAEAVLALTCAGGRAAELCVSAEVDRPSVIGFLRPRILLPTNLLANLSSAELEQVVLHEMEHLRRRDDWTNLLQKLSLALFPLHPALHWLDRRMCLERELACDDGVLRTTKGPKAYAACLANLAEHSMLRRGVALALGIFGKGQPELARRVYRILRAPEVRMGRAETQVATGLLLAGVAGGAIALAASPRLVSFGDVPEPVMQAQAASQTPAPRVMAAAIANPAATAAQTSHLVLASAVVQHGKKPVTVKAVATPGTARQPQVVHVIQKRVSLPRPHLALAEWQQEMTVPNFVLAVDQNSQFTYAAVPVRGGWLLVQL